MAVDNVVLVVAEDAHVELVASRMRRSDIDETLASEGLGPHAALARNIKMGEFARTVFINGEPAAMFGIVPYGQAWVPWLLTTDVVDKFPLSFWRASKHILAELLKAYPVLVQNIDARYIRALHWAERLGFKVFPPEPFGQAGMPFHLVIKKAVP